jgi:hypothetical protein
MKVPISALGLSNSVLRRSLRRAKSEYGVKGKGKGEGKGRERERGRAVLVNIVVDAVSASIISPSSP